MTATMDGQTGGGRPALMNGKPATGETSGSFDALDLRIIAILQAEGRLGLTEIGRRVNLSQPAVSARVRRLEQSGVISGYRAVVDPARLGLRIHAVIRLRTTHANLPGFGPVTTSLVLSSHGGHGVLTPP